MNTFNSTLKEGLGGLQLSRPNQMLAALLGLQVIIAVVVLWPRGEGEVSSLAVTGFEMDEVTTFTLVNDLGEELTVEQGEGGWVLPAADSYPVTESKVTEVLTQVVGLSTNRLVTRTSGSHSRLKVADDDFSRKLVIQTGSDSHTLYLGTSPSAGATHIRRDGEDETYLTADLNTFQLDARPSSWIDTLYFSHATAGIREIRLQNAVADLTFTKTEADEWTLSDLAADEALQTDNVASLATRVSSIRMLEPLGKMTEDWFNLDAPLATLTATAHPEGGEAQTFTIAVGAKNEDNQHVIKASNSDYYVLVSDFTVQDFIEHTRQDYLAQPEEEGAEDGGTSETGTP